MPEHALERGNWHIIGGAVERPSDATSLRAITSYRSFSSRHHESDITWPEPR
jgi:hypothetical protein